MKLASVCEDDQCTTRVDITDWDSEVAAAAVYGGITDHSLVPAQEHHTSVSVVLSGGPTERVMLNMSRKVAEKVWSALGHQLRFDKNN